MQKGTIAEQVIQRMKEKKQLEQKNRPDNQILRLEATFAIQLNKKIKEEIIMLQGHLKKQEKTLADIQMHCLELDYTGKKDFPRIIVKPDFIGSEKVDSKVKEFYLKFSKTFLRMEILRKRSYEASEKQENDLVQLVDRLREEQQLFWKKKKEYRRIQNQKRLKVCAEQVRLKKLKDQIKDIQDEINIERQERIQIITEYDLKKVNAENRKFRIKQLEKQINQYKQKIEEGYNPIIYRDHLKKIFSMETKNQKILKNIQDIRARIKTVQIETQFQERKLQKSNILNKIGKIGSLDCKRRRHSTMKTQSHSLLKNQEKIIPSFINISAIYSEPAPKKPKDCPQISRTSQLHMFQCNSPKYVNSMGSTGTTNRPKYRSAFSKRRR